MTTPTSEALLEESDRGCVLLGAAVLEECIEELFHTVFIHNGISKRIQDSLFGSNGPLSTFSSKIKMAYSLGFVSKHIYEDLDAIRRVRNDFAHTSRSVDFLSSETSEVLEGLHCVQEFKDALPRYSLSTEKSVSEAEMRVAGYIKRTKSLFVIGVQNLKLGVLRARMTLEGIPDCPGPTSEGPAKG